MRSNIKILAIHNFSCFEFPFFAFKIWRKRASHGLRMPNEAFFSTFGLGHIIWTDKFWGILGIFDQFISMLINWLNGCCSNHFRYCESMWVPCPCFPLIHYFYKKVSVYIHVPNIYLGLGFKFEFEFGPQIFRDLAILCP